MSVLTLSSPQAVMFAINAGIKMTHNFRKAYAKSIRSKSLVLPLPAFKPDTQPDIIIDFFTNEESPGFDYRELEPIKSLLPRLESTLTSNKLTKLERLELEKHYIFYHSEVNGAPLEITSEELSNLYRVRQWEQQKDDDLSYMQLVAGSVIDLGVDYFREVPGALNLDTTQGKVMKTFLEAVDQIEFADSNNIKRDISKKLIPGLFSATAESISFITDDLTESEGLRQLIKTTSEQLIVDLEQHFATVIDPDKKDEAVSLGRTIFKSIIANAGEFTFANSSLLFDTNSGVSALINSTGSALLNIILDENQGFTPSNLDQVVRAAFEAVAEHPEWTAKHEGIRAIISGVADTFSSHGIVNRPGLAPECIRLILEQTALNIDLFRSDDPTKVGESILVVGLKELMTALSAPQGDGLWKPSLSNTQVVGILNALTDQLVYNQTLINEKVGNRSLLGHIITNTLAVIATAPSAERFTGQTLTDIIHLNLRAVTSNPAFLTKINREGDSDEVLLINSALDIIFSNMMVQQGETNGIQTVKRYRLSKMYELMDYSLNLVLNNNPDRRGLLLLDAIVFGDTGLDFSEESQQTIGQQLMDATLRVADEHPELLAQKDFLKSVISDTAHTVRTFMPDQTPLIPEISRLLLENMADHMDLWLAKDGTKQQLLLSKTFAAVLKSISEAPEAGKWTPKLSGTQILEVLDLVTMEALNNPAWTKSEKLALDIMNGVFNALKQAPTGERLPYDIFYLMVKKSFYAVSNQKSFKLQFGEANEQANDQLAVDISYSLEQFTINVYSNSNDLTNTWTISNVDVFKGLFDMFMGAIIDTNASKERVDELVRQFETVLKDYNKNVHMTISDLFERLEMTVN